MIVAFNVEHQIRVACQGPCTQTCQTQFMPIARRTSCRVTADVPVGLLQRINEAQRRWLGIFAQVVINRSLNIPAGLITRDDRLGRQTYVPDRPCAFTR